MNDKDYATFILTKGGDAIAQLRLSEAVLEKMRLLNDYDLRALIEWRERRKRKRKPETLKVGDLKHGLRGVKLWAEVVEKSELRMVNAKDGNIVPFSMAVLSDGTGRIQIPLWGKRVGMVSVGDTILVEGGRVGEYLGLLQLQVGRGKITVIREESRGES